MADFEVIGGSGPQTSVYLVRPLNPEATTFLTSLGFEGWQYFGNAIAVEHRYVDGFVAQLRDDGFEVEGE